MKCRSMDEGEEYCTYCYIEDKRLWTRRLVLLLGSNAPRVR